MGMDINGLNPTIRGDKPEFPDNWDELSEKAKDYYNELDQEFHDNNPGVYFRANIWAWRPIHLAIVQSNISLELGIDEDTIDGMSYNSGHGLKTQEECNKLADALQMLIDGMGEDGVTEFGFNLGSWNLRNGSFMVDDKDKKILDEKYPYGTLIHELPVKLATKDKVRNVWPSHVTKVEHLQEFVNFLKHCGGFEIY